LDKLGELEQRIDKLESANSSQSMPEWFRVWSENVYSKDIARLNKIEDVLEKHSLHLNKIEDVLQRNNLK
jgi:hypothetical protein